MDRRSFLFFGLSVMTMAAKVRFADPGVGLNSISHPFDFKADVRQQMNAAFDAAYADFPAEHWPNIYDMDSMIEDSDLSESSLEDILVEISKLTDDRGIPLALKPTKLILV